MSQGKSVFKLDTLKCTPSCTIRERQNNLCITNYFPKKEDNFNILDIVINQTRYELFNNFDPSVVNGKFIKEKGAKIIIKRTNEKNEDDNDIDLTECEEMLKEHYNISLDEYLYLFRIDIEQEGMAVPSFEYELLYPIETQNLQKLNLTICKDVKVKIDIPFNLTDDLEKYNSSSPYYNDICYTFTSGSGTEEYSPKNFERKLSSLIIFPKLVYNIDTGEYYKLTKNFSLFLCVAIKFWRLRQDL